MKTKTCNRTQSVSMGSCVALALILAEPARADDPAQQARQTIEAFKKADPGISKFFDGSAGYAVFSTVGKGAVGVGGAHGSGILFEKGNPVGKVSQSIYKLEGDTLTLCTPILPEVSPRPTEFKGGEPSKAWLLVLKRVK